MNKTINQLCPLASGMEASVYFAPSITVIELAQETSVCQAGSPVSPLEESTHDGIYDDDTESIW